MALSLVSHDLPSARFPNRRRRQSFYWLLICSLAAALPATPASAKQRVDLIVVHGTVVTMDAKRRILEDGAIAVQGDAVAAIDTSANIDATYESGKIIDARGGLVLPGLII
jgi:adenine deaminase